MIDKLKSCTRCGKCYVPDNRNSGCPYCRTVDVVRQYIDAYNVEQVIADYPALVSSGLLQAMGVKKIGDGWWIPWQAMRMARDEPRVYSETARGE